VVTPSLLDGIPHTTCTHAPALYSRLEYCYRNPSLWVNHNVKTHDQRYQAFLRKLRAARKQAGMTQVQVALRLGQTQAYIWKCEVGERRVDLIEAAMFAKVYQKKITYFLPQ
jgi:DNA-binding XRE family transcriptional regulator